MSARSSGQRPLLILLLGVVGVLLVDTVRYTEAVRLFPLIILGALAGIVSVLLLADWHAGAGRFLGRFAGIELADVERMRRTIEAHEERGEAVEEREGRRRPIAAFIAWMLGLLFVSAILGFLVAIPLFLMAFSLLRAGSISAARKALPSAIAVTLGTTLFIYVVFVLLLGLPLGRPLL